MERELLKNNILISYSVLREYQKHYDQAQSKRNGICNRLREKNKKKNLISSMKAPLIMFLFLMTFATIFNIFSDSVDENAFYLVFISLKEILKLFTFQLGFGAASIAYGIYFLLVWWFYDKVFTDEYSCNYLMRFYKNHPDFQNDLNDYQALKQRAHNFKQTERFKNDVKFIPVKYRNTGIVAKLFGYVDDQRADTLKEALNLYVNESHQERMEVEQRLQSDSIHRAEEAAINAQISARNAEINSNYRNSVDINIRHK